MSGLVWSEEAAASSARSRLSSFWPPQGPVAGTPAGAVIQVGAAMLQGCPPSAYPTVPLHFSHTTNMQIQMTECCRCRGVSRCIRRAEAV